MGAIYVVDDQIPSRGTSRYAGQYAGVTDPGRLLEILTESRKIALTSTNPDTAHARFELAIEVYHQLMVLRLRGDVGRSVRNTMNSLVIGFPAQVAMNEAKGFRDKAAKLKTARKKLELLHRARDVLERALGNDSGHSSIQDAVKQVCDEIADLGNAIT